MTTITARLNYMRDTLLALSRKALNAMSSWIECQHSLLAKIGQ